jgi:hypothetical protein
VINCCFSLLCHHRAAIIVGLVLRCCWCYCSPTALFRWCSRRPATASATTTATAAAATTTTAGTCKSGSSSRLHASHCCRTGTTALSLRHLLGVALLPLHSSGHPRLHSFLMPAATATALLSCFRRVDGFLRLCGRRRRRRAGGRRGGPLFRRNVLAHLLSSATPTNPRRHMHTQTDRHTHTHTHKLTYEHTNKQTNKQTHTPKRTHAQPRVTVAVPRTHACAPSRSRPWLQCSVQGNRGNRVPGSADRRRLQHQQHQAKLQKRRHQWRGRHEQRQRCRR